MKHAGDQTQKTQIREATVQDLPRLVEIENTCFTSDRISRRQFQYLLSKANATVLVAELGDQLVGTLVVLFSRGTSLGRLYSIAVDPGYAGRGIGRSLVGEAESAVWDHHRAYIRLEIRTDNQASIGLFESMGYRRIGEWPDYYEDHATAVRYEKHLTPDIKPNLRDIPFFEQSLEFTCGPASLMMAMCALDKDVVLDRKLELRIWREATTIFMTAGHGGCGPIGLAIAAATRGFEVEIFLSDDGVQFVDSVRDPVKKEVMRLVQEDMLEQAAALKLPISYGGLSLDDMQKAYDDGAIPVVLISSWLIYGEKFPHWITVTGIDEHFVFAHDPFIDYDAGETQMDSVHMPIPREQFDRMTRYGKARLQAALLLYPLTSTPKKKP
ncbi:MAG: ribosomal protein S18 acetylase RimI-like enzyme [Candidatus Omnitrophota bacterium]|jgi:ribosomal protein S18 acetylase RimI-like enzyme